VARRAAAKQLRAEKEARGFVRRAAAVWLGCFLLLGMLPCVTVDRPHL
jgi:hypothetical protein